MPKYSVADDAPSSPLAERLAALNDGEMFLPTDFLQAVVLPNIAASFVVLVATYTLSFVVVSGFLPKDADLKQKRKASYQVTNFFANLVLTVSGLYFQYWILHTNLTEEEKTQGHEEVFFMSCFQLGYQLWSIPVGLFFVDESSAMLAHHATVVAVSSMSGFLRNGFRYWTPFFYGVIELSSIPLSMVSFLKDNPSLAQKYPQIYIGLRMVFALTFLPVRIYMFIPRNLEFLGHQYLLFSTHPLLIYRIYMSIVWLSSFFLLVLQIYWATLIVKGLVKHFFWGSKKKKKTS